MVERDELCYTVHHCWSWVVAEALSRIAAGARVTKCSRWKELPSVGAQSSAAAEPSYALFRVERGRLSVWCVSRAFESLDAKDALQRRVPADAMPPTLLLPWDASGTASTVEAVQAFMDERQGRVLLKAALGSGGHGLYFVSDAADVLKVIKAHAALAEARDGFLDGLRAQYGGEVPMWSLQALLQPALVSGRRSQVRMYVVFVESLGCCFFHPHAEVRLPFWEGTDEDEARGGLELDAYEQGVCVGSRAVPYNHGRVKRETERLMLSECPELSGSENALCACLRRAFSALSPELQLSVVSSPAEAEAVVSRERVAVIGADLLVQRSESSGQNLIMFQAHLLEVNNNPAIPQPDKHRMSPAYRAHLVSFCAALVELGLSGGRAPGVFVRI